MVESDAQIKASIRAILESWQIQVEDIAEEKNKTPDLHLDRELPGESLLEIKTKGDNPKDIAELEAELEGGQIVGRVNSTGGWKRIDEIIAHGLKQLQAKDPSRLLPHFMWVHCVGANADLFATRVESTLYGQRKLVASGKPNILTCYYYWNSAFFRHRSGLDGVVISQEGSARLCLNDYSTHFELAKNSSLARGFCTAIFYPSKDLEDMDTLINDSTDDRSDEKKTVAYLREKYRLEDLQTIDMRHYVGVIRVPD